MPDMESLNRAVEEARAKLALWTYPYTGIDQLGFAHDMDALIASVEARARAEERDRYRELIEAAEEYRDEHDPVSIERLLVAAAAPVEGGD